MTKTYALVDSSSRILEISDDRDDLIERSGRDREVVLLIKSHEVGDVIDYTDRGIEMAMYDCLYDSETNEYLTAEELGINDDQYAAACLESASQSAAEGHIRLAGRRVYANV